MINTISLFQLKVSTKSMSELIKMVPVILNRSQFEIIITLNPVIYEQCQQDSSLRKYLKSALFAIPDGAGVCWAIKILTNKKVDRCPGIEFVSSVSCCWSSIRYIFCCISFCNVICYTNNLINVFEETFNG